MTELCATAGAGRACFLLVDDDEAFLGALERSLRKRGIETVGARSSAEALAVARFRDVTHAIVDLKIARESGLHLLLSLRALRPALPIVMLTGFASVATAVEAIKLGATHYLQKPASVDEILDAFGQQAGDPQTAPRLQPASVDRVEWEHIQKVLQDCDGNISATARALGMHRRTLQRKLQKHPPRDAADAAALPALPQPDRA